MRGAAVAVALLVTIALVAAGFVAGAFWAGG